MTLLAEMTAQARALVENVDRLERMMPRVIREADADSLGALWEMHRDARELEVVLRSKELHGPVLGVQRMIEARIGQHLGPPDEGE